MTLTSNPSTGPASIRSRALPWGTPSTMSMRTMSPSSLAAAQWAAVAPTLPAPTMVIFGLGLRVNAFPPLSRCFAQSDRIFTVSVTLRMGSDNIPPAAYRASRSTERGRFRGRSRTDFRAGAQTSPHRVDHGHRQRFGFVSTQRFAGDDGGFHRFPEVRLRHGGSVPKTGAGEETGPAPRPRGVRVPRRYASGGGGSARQGARIFAVVPPDRLPLRRGVRRHHRSPVGCAARPNPPGPGRRVRSPYGGGQKGPASAAGSGPGGGTGGGRSGRRRVESHHRGPGFGSRRRNLRRGRPAERFAVRRHRSAAPLHGRRHLGGA